MWTIIFQGKTYKDKRDIKTILLSLKKYLEDEKESNRNILPNKTNT
jgi:hypothetical protein